MGLFEEKEIDASNLPINSSFLEHEGFVYGSTALSTGQVISCYKKVLIGPGVEIRLYFLKRDDYVGLLEDLYLTMHGLDTYNALVRNEIERWNRVEYINYYPLFIRKGKRVDNFFNDIDTEVRSIGDYYWFLNDINEKLKTILDISEVLVI